MNSTKLLTITLAAAAFIAQPVYAQQSTSDIAFGKMARFVSTPGSVKADIFMLGLSPDVEDLVGKVQQKVKQNPDWFKDYVSHLQPNQPTPYHQNFGINESEYQRMLEGTKEIKLVQNGDTQLTFGAGPAGTLKISGLPGDPPFDAVIYEAVSDSILSSYGIMKKSSLVQGTLDHKQSSAWAGRMWTIERKDSQSQVNVAFVLGELITEPKHLLIHEVKGTVNNQTIDYHYMLVWDK